MGGTGLIVLVAIGIGFMSFDADPDHSHGRLNSFSRGLFSSAGFFPTPGNYDPMRRFVALYRCWRGVGRRATEFLRADAQIFVLGGRNRSI